MPDTGWYYLVEGRMGGPCDLDELLSGLRAGDLSENCQAWSPGMKEWRSLREIRTRRARSTTSNGSSGAGLNTGGVSSGVEEAAHRPPEKLHPVESPPETGSTVVEAGGGGSEGDDAPTADGEADAAQTEQGDTAVTPNGSLARAAAAIGWGARPELAELAVEPAFTDFEEISAGRLHKSSPPRPWYRWFARIVDTTLAALALGIALAIIAPQSGLFESNFTAALFVLAAWLITESLVLTLFGTTPGKALMNIELTRANGERLGLEQAFGRSLRVWAFGMAGGLPIANLVAMALAYRKLTSQGRTSWDREGDFVVRHGRLGVMRIIGVAGFALIYIALMVLSALPA